MSTNNKRGLGRGLDSIFIDNTSPSADTGNRFMLRLSDMQPRSDQPRKTFEPEQLEQLAESIAAQGLIQPIVVRESENGFYEIIAGERRWRASKMAGLTEVPVVVMTADERKTAEISLVENIQRQDLTPIEEALAYRTLMVDFHLTQEDVAKRMGKSRSAIANLLRILELPEEVKTLVNDGKLSSGHAKVLLSLVDREMIPLLAVKVVTEEISVRELEAMVKKHNKEYAAEAPSLLAPDAVSVNYLNELANKVSLHLGRHVKIVKSGANRKLELFFTDDRDLEGIISALCGENVFDDY